MLSGRSAKPRPIHLHASAEATPGIPGADKPLKAPTDKTGQTLEDTCIRTWVFAEPMAGTEGTLDQGVGGRIPEEAEAACALTWGREVVRNRWSRGEIRWAPIHHRCGVVAGGVTELRDSNCPLGSLHGAESLKWGQQSVSLPTG